MDPEDDDLEVGGELVLSGFVGDSWMDEGFTYAQVVRALKALKGADVTVRVNSGGGYATEGAAIMAALKAHPGRVTARVEGIAASAASLMVMGADEVVMTDGALMMIHDPSGLTIGDADAHRRTAGTLDKLADTYAAAYAAKSGMDPEKVRALMIAETWMSGAEAVALGFADRVESADTEEEEPAVAAFDFRIYARAPKELRALAAQKGWRLPASPRSAAPAASQQRDFAMTAKTEMAAPKQPAETPTDAAKEAQMKTEQAAKAAAEKAVAAERARVLGIRDAAAKLKLDAKVADELIADGVEIDDARARMIDAWAKLGDTHEYGARPAEPRGDRLDERETMREGMAAALLSKIGGPKPETDKARPYMDMGIVEMAAHAVGHRGSLIRAAERERVLMAATHSTSDFPAIFENALNKALAARYVASAPTYREVSRFKQFADFRPHPVVNAGDFPKLQEVAENGEIKAGTFTEKKETVTAKAYGVQVGISRHMLVNDDLNALGQVIADQGEMVAQFEDELFWTMVLSGSSADGPTLVETSRQVFNTTDKTKASSGAAIDITTLSAARKALREQKSLDGRPLNNPASILLVGPAYETLAQQIVAPIQAQQAGNVNPFSGTMRVVVTPWITGNAWYAFVDPARGSNFVWGLLDGYSAPRMRMDEPFGTQGMSFSVEHDFGVGAVDHRFGFKNAGA